ncbi:UNVERIFIED_CONTAM: Receptor kinase-like protein Xa21 [Sesamum calycinum]|uniref:Receptor kinase-like protein Xa21 n=1 Tax=Sesamum calycinum TaxID=2727403 RepID=A0AAW2NF11_9LAMI
MTSYNTVKCLILFIFFYFASNPATCSIYEADLRALLSFQENIIDPRGALDSWRYNETVNYCTWKGISCSRRHRTRVVSIDLDSQGLLGSLSPHLVTTNHLQGNIPSDIGFSLPNLKFLGLGGPMPKDLGSLSALWGLTMGSNNIQDDISFISSLTNCTNLKSLEISYNFLTGVLPHTIANLSTHLSLLAMSSNLIHGTIPSAIGDLTGLSILVLENNLFSGPIPLSIGGLTKLQEIYLSANKFTGKLPFSLGNLTLLNAIYMDINNISGSIPPSLGNCSGLLLLNLSNNNLIGPIPRELLTLSSISIFLDLSNNNLLGSIPSEVGSLRNLGCLDFSNNRLSGIVPSTISSCISLQQLYLGGNSFHGEIPQGLSLLKGLQELDLSRNNFSGLIPSFLEELSLEKLNLSFNKLQGPVPVKGFFRMLVQFHLRITLSYVEAFRS